MWDFSTDPEFQEKLDWMKTFVREEVEPLDVLFPEPESPYDVTNKAARAIIAPLRQKVKDKGLWACHLGKELGGPGYGQVMLGLMNEIMGATLWGPTVFGAAAPDTGNSEILAMFGTAEQKQRYLGPLLDGDIVSCFSMTEPQAGADPGEFTTKAWREGDEWVIEGYKWFSSNAKFASFFIVIAATDMEAPLISRMSMFIIPAETPGVKFVRNVGIMGEPNDGHGSHGYMHYDKVRVPLDAMLGGVGEGFKVAQARLGGGRIHHAMRAVGRCRKALDMMIERAVSRRTKGKRLGDHQFVQGDLADCYIALEQFRLLVLQTAWTIDTQPHGAARTGIAMCKVVAAKVYNDIFQKAIHLHGSLGMTHELSLIQWYQHGPAMGLADGPSEVHKIAVAKALMKNAKPAEGLFPSQHLLPKREAAWKRYGHIIEAHQKAAAQ